MVLCSLLYLGSKEIRSIKDTTAEIIFFLALLKLRDRGSLEFGPLVKSFRNLLFSTIRKSPVIIC